MHPRMKKLIGGALLVAFLGFYFVLVIAIGSGRIAETEGLGKLFFYAVAGLLWVLPAGVLIRWMQQPASVRPRPPGETGS